MNIFCGFTKIILKCTKYYRLHTEHFYNEMNTFHTSHLLIHGILKLPLQNVFLLEENCSCSCVVKGPDIAGETALLSIGDIWFDLGLYFALTDPTCKTCDMAALSLALNKFSLVLSRIRGE